MPVGFIRTYVWGCAYVCVGLHVRMHEGTHTYVFPGAFIYFSTKAKSSCFFSRFARATLMVTGSPKLNFLW